SQRLFFGEALHRLLRQAFSDTLLVPYRLSRIGFSDPSALVDDDCLQQQLERPIEQYQHRFSPAAVPRVVEVGDGEKQAVYRLLEEQSRVLPHQLRIAWIG